MYRHITSSLISQESKAMKEKATSLKEALEAKSKMQSVSIAESNKFQKLAGISCSFNYLFKLLLAGLQEKLLHLTKVSEK